MALSGCGFILRDQEPSETTSPGPPPELIARGDLYCDLSRPAYLSRGYVHSKCDGSGFTSLYSVRCSGVNLGVFTDEDGKLWRSAARDCFKSGESKAESSRDMWLMRMAAAYVHRDLAWVTKSLAYAEAHNWVVCEAIDPAYKLGRCVLTPQLVSLLRGLKGKLETGLDATRAGLTGEDDGVGLPVHQGFEAHLDGLRIWLSGEVYGAITAKEKELLGIYAARETRNALFQAVYHAYHDGVMDSVWEILSTWPDGRLPGTQDWREPYLWQRDQSSDSWQPGAAPFTDHDGADFNLALYIAMGGKP